MKKILARNLKKSYPSSNRGVWPCLLVIGLLLNACSKVDDYLLGKDNTPKPTALAPIHPTVKLSQDWSVSIGKSSRTSTYLKLKPVILGNTVYTANVSGVVEAVDKSTGHLIWTKQLKQKLISGPTVKNGCVAVTTNTAELVVLQRKDGNEMWNVRVSSDVLAKPYIHANTVIVKTIDGILYAFNRQNGEKLWVMDHGAPSLILKAGSSPVVYNNMVLVGFSDGRLDAVDLESGRLLWQRSITYASGSSDVERLVDIDADPLVERNSIYLTTYQGYVGALSLDNGQFIWRKPSSVYKNMASDYSTLYLTDSNDVMWAYSKTNGQVKWKQLALKARGLTEPVRLGSWLIVGDKLGFIHVLSSQTGELLGRTQLSSPIDIAPSVDKNHVYVMTTNGKLSRFAVSNVT